MIGKVFAVLCTMSLICGLISGNIGQLSSSVIDGAANAVTLTISLLGMMCLWCGIMNVLKAAGFIEGLAKLLSPLLKILFPSTHKSGKGINEIAAAISANMLGIGNAATPLAMKVMETLSSDNESFDETYASDDMVTFTVLGTASIDIIPTTLIALRRAAGSSNPFEIIIPIWICSLACAFAAVLFSKALSFISRRSKY